MFGKLTDQNNGLVITMNWITDCLFLSMLWAVLSVFLLPLGPATAALYDTAVHVFRRGERVVYRYFFASLRRNMKVGIPAGIIALVIGAAGFRIWNHVGAAAQDSQMGYVLLWSVFVLLLFLLGIFGFLFPLLSRFETGIGKLFSNCVALSILHLPRTAALSMIGAVSIWLCVWFWWPVIIVPCLSSIVASFFIEPVFEPFMAKEEQNETP